MEELRNLCNDTDRKITRWMARYGILLLRLSVGIVFLWCGALRFFAE